MPKLFEVFGYRITDNSPDAVTHRKEGKCPFMNSECDGGGNRHLSNINLTHKPDLQAIFGSRASIPSGVCSIQLVANQMPWIVCPHRLLVLGKHEHTEINHQDYVRNLLFGYLSLPKGTCIGVWPELKMKFNTNQDGEHKSFDYTFDYILMPLGRCESQYLEKILEMKWSKIRRLCENAGYSIVLQDGREFIDYFPLGTPIIIEIMTSSTSGGNKKKRTTIPMAFEDSILGRKHDAPGINYRQVWARMVSQLVVKSEVGLKWGGKTYWILQDVLVDYISKSTALNIRNFLSMVPSEVNILCLTYGTKINQLKGVLELENGALFAGLISSEPQEARRPCFQDMIRAPITPPINTLYNLLLKRAPVKKFQIG